ncbi:MAG: 50S ribosomal protein L11 methyltransferase [Gammaproteobacteria bacterium]|jgi:ribosomal protein L11 methyltransferase|nr:50S ribosomal protein L11 methyltransferase [Gammaproteobacteria bacterium]
MGWIQLQLSTTPDLAEDLESLLEANRSLAITLVDAADQPVFEPIRGETPLWDSIILKALFPAETDPEKLIQQLNKSYLPKKLPPVELKVLEDEDWERAWMDNFKPLCFGDNLWICPSWATAPKPEAVNIMLDPGLAFGTGTHPTTALCLSWLDQQELKNQVIIDYGCGSGILGIAALLLGAEQVIGVDNDPQALIASSNNCEKNQIDPARFPTYLPKEFVEEIKLQNIKPTDTLLANILAGPLIDLAAYLAALVKPNGGILLSGILEEQAESVRIAYEPWFKFEPITSQDGWVRIAGHRIA